MICTLHDYSEKERYDKKLRGSGIRKQETNRSPSVK